jgi:hypothetical protein
MMGVEGHSEYDGGGVMPNTVYPKGSEALTASDKLRLQSITGQEDDSRAPVDPYFWNGNMRPDPNEERRVESARQQKRQQIAKQERDRYRESPY